MMKKGFSFYFQKPFDPEVLAAQDIAVTVCEKDGAKALAAVAFQKE